MRLLALLTLLTLAACQRDAPPAPTAAEAARLDEAEAMLNAEAESTAPQDEN